jgi:hypothetical protein
VRGWSPLCRPPLGEPALLPLALGEGTAQVWLTREVVVLTPASAAVLMVSNDRGEATQDPLPLSSVVRPLDPGHDHEPELLEGLPASPVQADVLQEREETTPQDPSCGDSTFRTLAADTWSDHGRFTSCAGASGLRRAAIGHVVIRPSAGCGHPRHPHAPALRARSNVYSFCSILTAVASCQRSLHLDTRCCRDAGNFAQRSFRAKNTQRLDYPGQCAVDCSADLQVRGRVSGRERGAPEDLQ